MKAAFKLTSEQKFDSHLHRTLINRSAPYWAEIKFFYERKHELPLRERSTGGGMPTIWERNQLPEILDILSTYDELWETFDPALIDIYKTSEHDLPIEQHTRYHNLAHRIIWRASFSEHLKVVGEFSRQSASQL